MLEAPGLVLRCILLRLGQLEDVPRAPGDHVVAPALDEARAPRLRAGERVGDRAREARLFCDEEAHGSTVERARGARGALPSPTREVGLGGRAAGPRVPGRLRSACGVRVWPTGGTPSA